MLSKIYMKKTSHRIHETSLVGEEYSLVYTEYDKFLA